MIRWLALTAAAIVASRCASTLDACTARHGRAIADATRAGDCLETQ